MEAMVPRKIFERGSAYYYDDDAVGRIRRTGDTFKARVRGTENYRVELTVHGEGWPEIYCDCPYEHGDVCKHGIALGLAVLDLVGESEAANPAAPAPADPLLHVLNGAWARTSDKDKLNYLRQLLSQKPRQLRRFLEAFEFDEDALLALPVAAKAQPPRKPAPRRPLTLTEKAQQLLDAKKPQELLPLLLSVDWLREPPAWDTHTLPYLLDAAARAQPEAVLDAAMERFEGYMSDKALRGWPLYNRLAACLRALAALPMLTKQVQLFASELLRQHGRLRSLHDSLGRAGFALIAPEEAPVPRRRGRQPKAAGR